MSAWTFSDRMGTIRPAPVSSNRATFAALVRGPARRPPDPLLPMLEGGWPCSHPVDSFDRAPERTISIRLLSGGPLSAPAFVVRARSCLASILAPRAGPCLSGAHAGTIAPRALLSRYRHQ